jgi:hypothetical protein
MPSALTARSAPPPRSPGFLASFSYGTELNAVTVTELALWSLPGAAKDGPGVAGLADLEDHCPGVLIQSNVRSTARRQLSYSDSR